MLELCAVKRTETIEVLDNRVNLIELVALARQAGQNVVEVPDLVEFEGENCSLEEVLVADEVAQLLFFLDSLQKVFFVK